MVAYVCGLMHFTSLLIFTAWR